LTGSGNPNRFERFLIKPPALLEVIGSEDELMRTLLLHIACGYSLRETVVLAKSSGIADVSDVALLKRLRRAEEWFKALAGALFRESGMSIPRCANPVRMRLVDGTIVKEPGKTGSQWRFHYSLRAGCKL
jgi:hypothetical protein